MSTRRLEGLLTQRVTRPPADLAGQVAWIEAVSEAAADPALGDAGARAAQDLKAALGAIVAYARSPQQAAQALALEATVRTLTARALATLYGALADTYAALAATSRSHVAVLKEVASLFRAHQAAVVAGRPEAPEVSERLARLVQKLEAR